jgi:hypothetical protein
MGKRQKKINKILNGETTNDDDLKSSNFNLDDYLCMKYTNNFSKCKRLCTKIF